jgi:NAD+ kinase
VSTLLLVVNSERPAAVALVETIRAWWEERGYKVLGSEPDADPAMADFAISLGGDGTMLRTVHLTLPYSIPVLGVNLGRMGFLTEVEPAALEESFGRIVAGDYRIEERMVLEVTIASPGGAGSRHLAINEVIVEKTQPGHTIRVDVALSGTRFLTYVADGLLACTPTGSTAYNLSARGPVISPRLRAVVLTPVAPHLVFDRSVVLDAEETVEMTLLDGPAAAAVVDGVPLRQLAAGDVVACRAATERARLITLDDMGFHSVLRSRFGLSDR